MSNEPIAQTLKMWRRYGAILSPFVFAACGGSTPPAEAPTTTSTNEPPLGQPAAAVPPVPVEEIEPKKNQFDEEQARIVLNRAAANAHTCIDMVDKDQPRGDATVIVTFSGVGKSTKASIAAPYDNTPIGRCATRAFVNIIVPPFAGPDVELLQQVSLKPETKKAADASTAKKTTPAKK